MSTAAEHNRPQPMSFEEQQRMMHATYVARMQRRSMPPRCNPFTILLLVVAIGMAFIGVTMTIISHWPGATQIGDDPLKIAGPVLFGVGGLLIFFTIVLIYFLNEHERHKWVANLHRIVADKLNGARNSKLEGDAEKLGPGSTGPAHYSDLDHDDPRRLASERGVDLLPDPRHGSKSSGYADSGETDVGSAVPQPLRITKKRRSTQPRGDVSASDVSVGSGDLAPAGMTSTRRQDSGGLPVYANLSYEADTPEGERRDRPARSGGGKDGKRKRQPGPATADPIRDPVMRNIAAQQQQLRVHIKAQPGTAVHITPSATPPTRPAQAPAPAYHARQPGQRQPASARAFSSGAESETEI